MDVMSIDQDYLERIKKLYLPERRESNPYLVLCVYGDGVRAPEKWNAKIYRDKDGNLTLVTVDVVTLKRLMEGRSTSDGKKVISVDDAGWGFPLGGVLIGATNEKRVETGLIAIECFQGPCFKEHAYLREAAQVTLSLLKRFKASPDDTRVEICSGYINSESKNALREAGFEVNVVEVTGLLQFELEQRFKEYVETLGYHAYFDPKEVHDASTPFKKVIEWIDEKPEERMKLAKSGWKYFTGRDKTPKQA
jgi:hypothetical protein